jgi:hypothetical protein
MDDALVIRVPPASHEDYMAKLLHDINRDLWTERTDYKFMPSTKAFEGPVLIDKNKHSMQGFADWVADDRSYADE